MTQEDKQLLLKELSARLPYHPRINVCNDSWEGCQIGEFDTNLYSHHIDAFVCDRIEVKPYLRPMSSMTEEEKTELNNIIPCGMSFSYTTKEELIIYNDWEYDSDHYFSSFVEIQDWLNSKHFDYRGLIEKFLALEAPNGMYKTQ